MTSQISISNAGSRVVMPFVNGILNFGYCHVFEGHMEFSDGTKKNKVNGKGQFQNAQYPETTMKIIMEVINGTTELIPERDNKFSKTKYSKTERQNVKVILRRGKDVTAGNYSAYDWVVVTAYPIF